MALLWLQVNYIDMMLMAAKSSQSGLVYKGREHHHGTEEE